MANSPKKQRQCARRKSKRLSVRRRESRSPVTRLAEAPGEPECWASENFEEFGQQSIFTFKRGAGLSGMACFLIDRGVVGLKDAWIDIGLTEVDFRHTLNAERADGLKLKRIPIADVRRWVAGGARWASDNGMRLPKDWLRAAELIGGVAAWQSADVSAFTKEFAGHPEDLRQRLIAEPFETYVKRTDIQFTSSDDAAYKDQATGDYIHDDSLPTNLNELETLAKATPVEELNFLAERFTPAATALTAETTAWLADQQIPPSAELFEAWRSAMLASMLANAGASILSKEELADMGFEFLENMADRIDPARQDVYHQAVGQVLDHLRVDPTMMQKAVQFGLQSELEKR